MTNILPCAHKNEAFYATLQSKNPVHADRVPFRKSNIQNLESIKKPVGSNQATPAARANFCLLLLPSGPDKIHSMTPHGTQSSSPTDLIIISPNPIHVNL